MESIYDTSYWKSVMGLCMYVDACNTMERNTVIPWADDLRWTRVRGRDDCDDLRRRTAENNKKRQSLRDISE